MALIDAPQCRVMRMVVGTWQACRTYRHRLRQRRRHVTDGFL